MSIIIVNYSVDLNCVIIDRLQWGINFRWRAIGSRITQEWDFGLLVYRASVGAFATQ
ncbi:hypothetical protein MNBD_ALPHA11-2371 [hydrothermal vent metagenome]|uniref:Uncharacterized protein n=1 Tax=hydrothermal vent metagenome TaxID=652676 RepID=A0A3B0U9U9_9ZZZZ